MEPRCSSSSSQGNFPRWEDNCQKCTPVSAPRLSPVPSLQSSPAEHVIPQRAGPLRSAARCSGGMRLAPVAAPLLSRCPPGVRRGHTLEVHRGRAPPGSLSLPRAVNRDIVYIVVCFLARSARGRRRTLRPPVWRQGRVELHGKRRLLQCCPAPVSERTTGEGRGPAPEAGRFHRSSHRATTPRLRPPNKRKNALKRKEKC